MHGVHSLHDQCKFRQTFSRIFDTKFYRKNKNEPWELIRMGAGSIRNCHSHYGANIEFCGERNNLTVPNMASPGISTTSLLAIMSCLCNRSATEFRKEGSGSGKNSGKINLNTLQLKIKSLKIIFQFGAVIVHLTCNLFVRHQFHLCHCRWPAKNVFDIKIQIKRFPGGTWRAFVVERHLDIILLQGSPTPDFAILLPDLKAPGIDPPTLTPPRPRPKQARRGISGTLLVWFSCHEIWFYFFLSFYEIYEIPLGCHFHTVGQWSCISSI